MFCTRTEEFLRQRGISFEERDISQDEAALAELEALGAYSTPVTVIDGAVVTGFDRQRLEELLTARSP